MTDPLDSSYLYATYQIQNVTENLQKRAEGIAIGLTIGSWTDLPNSKQKQMREHCGIVAAIEPTPACANQPPTAEITIGYPVQNFTPTFASILTTIFGKLSLDGPIKLIRLSIPESFLKLFPGPKFGVTGMRQQLNTYNRPLIMSIFKSCIGLSLDELSARFREQALGGVDFVKDDEIFFMETYATPEVRVAAFQKIAMDVAQSTGTLTRYAVNLTGPLPAIFERAKRLVDLGAGALLLNVFTYGLDTLLALAQDADINVPILAHPAFSGAIYGAPNYGVHPAILLGQLTRMAGADILLYPSPYGSVTLNEQDAAHLVQTLRTKGPHRTVLPAPSAGIHPGLVPRLIADHGIDVMINAGGGIHGHPGGTVAGGKAFSAAVAAVLAGQPLESAAAHNIALQQAIDHWGIPS